MVPPSLPTGTLQFFWIDPNGDVHNLSRDYGGNVWVIAGSIGLGDSEFEIADSKLPLGPGSLIDRITTNPRKMNIPMFVRGDTLNDVILQAHELADWFATGDENGKTPGTFRVIRPDDVVRDIVSYKTRGLQGDMNEGSVVWTKYVIELYCPDPYPTDSADTVLTKTVAQAASFAVVNQGKLIAWPRFKLTGPYTNFLIRNDTYDKEITGTVVLTAGHYIVIDTRPSEVRQGLSVYDDLGANRISILGGDSDLTNFLQPGSNTLKITFTSGTTVATSVETTYLARYRSIMR